MTDLQKKLKTSLNERQYDVATLIDGPAVIMAGAGSGKTHTLMSRVANLVDSGYNAEQILMLTFTNAAADEMRERAENLLDERCKKIVACTYHKFCNMMLRRFGDNVGMKDYTILSYPETKNMIDYVKSSDPFFDNLKGFPTLGAIADMMSISVNNKMSIHDIILSVDKYSKYIDFEDSIELLIDKVQRYGQMNQKYTYDDLLVNMDKLLDNDDICRFIAEKYKFIMVDEFQDTNNLQESIILKLSIYNKNIVVVGDISQSIYAFRGANVRNLQSFNQKIAGCKTIVLNSNYRSTQKILDSANSVMQKNVKSWRYHNMVSVGGNGHKPNIIKVATQHDEAEFILSLIKKCHAKGVPYSEIAVLSRSSMATFSLENELSQESIPFNKMGGMKFMDYDCIGDMLAYFSIITNPHDLLSWFRVLRLHPHIGKKYAKAVADGCNVADFLVNNKYMSRKFYPELLLLDEAYFKFKSKDDFMDMFEVVKLFYFNVRERCIEFSKMNENNKEEERMKLDNDKYAVSVLQHMAQSYDSVVSFMDDIMLDSISEDVDDDKLTISTIHSAKGLEWSAVIIMDCIEGYFPAKIKFDMYGSPEDEEELRCFYVAMTRAKSNLFLITPKYRMTYDGIEQAAESHYLLGSHDYFNILDLSEKNK